MIDLVYVIGIGSPSGNLELKYSIASVEKFGKGVRNIYVIGEDPGFRGNFIHIPDMDRGRNKQHNIMLKILIACEHPDISDPFCFMNDDFILTKNVDLSVIPYYYNTNITRMWKSKRKPGHYKTALINTLIALSEKDLPLKHFDIHIPILYYKENFVEAMGRYNWNERDGYVIKSLYCNTIGVDPVLSIDPKVVPAYSESEEIASYIKDWFMFSFDDISFTEGMKSFLQSLFPNVIR